jgi:hypothetical protein
MNLNLNLTKDDYKAIAESRASRLAIKYKTKNQNAIEWVGILGLGISTAPAILTSINGLDIGGKEAGSLGLILVLLLIFMIVRVEPQYRLRHKILLHWGISTKKGGRNGKPN